MPTTRRWLTSTLSCNRALERVTGFAEANVSRVGSDESFLSR